MNPTDEHLRRFLVRYGEALSAGDLKAISGCYIVPSLVLSDEGSVPITAREEIEAAFDGAAERYRAQGLVALWHRCASSPTYEVSPFDRAYLFTAFLIPVATNPKRAPQITLTTMPPMRPTVSSKGIDAVSSGLHVKNVCKKTAIATPITA